MPSMTTICRRAIAGMLVSGVYAMTEPRALSCATNRFDDTTPLSCFICPDGSAFQDFSLTSNASCLSAISATSEHLGKDHESV